MTRVLSGIQPTGTIHIGNYFGAITNWIRLTETYDCYYAVVDYHALTATHDPSAFPRVVEEAVVSLLAAGLDPERCHLFLQSAVPEHTELAWILRRWPR